MTAARTLEAVFGLGLPIAVGAYDGSRLGPAYAPATLVNLPGRVPNSRGSTLVNQPVIERP
jgi:hypothetical protein